MILQTVSQNSQALQNQAVSENENLRLQTCLQKVSENASEQPQNSPDDLAQISAAWPTLPEHIKAAIIYFAIVGRRIEEMTASAKRRTWRGRPTRKMRRIAELKAKSGVITHYPKGFRHFLE